MKIQKKLSRKFLHQVQLIILMVCVTLLSSCGPLIFKANFEDDTVNSAPNPNPPGDPNDAISGNCGITVINSNVFDSKAMRFYNQSSCNYKTMWFQSESVPTSNNFINYIFKGYVESENHDKFTLNFGAGHFTSAFNITYEHGQMFLTDGGYDMHSIGNYTPNQVQTFVVSLKRATNTYSLSILLQGNANIIVEDRPIKNSTYWGQNAYLLQAYYHQNPSQSNGYVFDDVQMNKQKED